MRWNKCGIVLVRIGFFSVQCFTSVWVFCRPVEHTVRAFSHKDFKHKWYIIKNNASLLNERCPIFTPDSIVKRALPERMSKY